jgi:hypothetical protein
MSRRVYLLGVGLALVALALAFTDWMLSLQPGLTKANMRRIRVGMTLEEVKALLCDWPAMVGLEGHPSFWADRVTQEELAYAGSQGNGRVVVDFADNETYRVQVLFREGRVVPPVDWLGPEDDPGLLARLRSWLGW